MDNFYCAAPWRGLHINSKGDVKTCCASPPIKGNLNSQLIEEILDGEKLKEIRSFMLQGKRHEYCNTCIDRENRGGDSERSWHNSVNADFDIQQADLTYQYPTIIDVRWNNTCNLSCNYCRPADSSKWAALKKLSVNTNTRHYYTDVCNFVKKNYDKIKEVALVGGEPLLLPENETLLDVIPTDCIVTLITNLSNPLENNKIFNKLKQRSRVGWSISFDNIGDRFEYVRHGAKWEMMLHNLELIQDLIKNNGHWGGIHAVYNLYNATKLCEFKKFAQDQNLKIKWQTLIGPRELDPRVYGHEIAKLAATEIQQVYDNFEVDNQEQELFDSAFTKYVNTNQPTSNYNIELLNQFVDDIENIYHPDSKGKFAKLWPEFGELLWPQNQH
jgi:MoaA/NifB/PqqE/SkfB family radical SAM enzyme